MPTVTMQRAAPLVHRHLSLSHLQSDNDGLPSHILRRRLSSKRDPAAESPGRKRVLVLVLATFLLCVLGMSLQRNTPSIFHAVDRLHSQSSTGALEVGVVSPLYLGELHTNPRHKMGSSVSHRSKADAGAPLNAASLLLASHNRVLWHDIETGANRVLHEGEVRSPQQYLHAPCVCYPHSNACSLTPPLGTADSHELPLHVPRYVQKLLWYMHELQAMHIA